MQKITYNVCCLCKKMKFSRLHYVTDYCTVMLSNRLVQFG